MAEAEVEKSSKRIRRQRLEAAERGERHAGGSREFGTVGVGKNAVSEAQAEAERELIREAAARMLSGDSLRGIVLDWLDRGVRTSTGRVFVNASLRQMLRSPRIAGMRIHHDKLYRGQWEPIIPVEEWKMLAEILNDPARKTNLRGGTPRYLLTGLIYCARCGRPAYGRKGRVYAGHRQPDAYGCHGLREEGGCGGVRRKMADVDGLITEALFVAVESPAWNQLADRPAADPSRELYEALAHDQGLLDRLEDKLAEELIRPETAKRKRAEIERRMEAARAKLAQLGDSRVAAQVPRNLRDVWPSLSLDRRRAILAAVIERIEVRPQGSGPRFDPDAIKVTWRS
jgi:site-specific DNA recombinase